MFVSQNALTQCEFCDLFPPLLIQKTSLIFYTHLKDKNKTLVVQEKARVFIYNNCKAR